MLRLLMMLNKFNAPMDSLLNGGGDSGGGTPPAAGTPPATPPAGGAPPASTWRDGLPDDIKSDATLAKYSDIKSLAAAHISLQRHLGADKIAVPGAHATDEDWKGVFAKLGLPGEVKDYAIKFKEGFTVKEDFVNGFRDQAHKAGVLPKQAQALADWFSDVNLKAEQDFAQERASKQEADLKALQTEWGNAFKPNLVSANRLLKEHGGEHIMKYLDETGLGNDVHIIRALAGIAKAVYGESPAKGQNDGGAGEASPADARKAAMDIINNKDNDLHAAYHDRSHPQHKTAMTRVQGFFEAAASKV